MSSARNAMKNALIESCKLEADIGPFLVVVEGTNVGGAKLPSGADVNFLGVTTEDGLNGEYRPVITGGGVIVKITASAAITRGSWVSVAGASGKIKAAAPGAGTNTYVLGRAVEAASADGDIIGVRLSPGIMQG